MEQEEQVSSDFNLQRVCSCQNYRFYLSDGPRYSRHEEPYINHLRRHNIRLLVRVNNRDREGTLTQMNGVHVLDVGNITSTLNNLSLMRDLEEILHVPADNEPLGIVLEGYENGAFVLGIMLVHLGLTADRAVQNIRRVGGEINSIQMVILSMLEWQQPFRYDIL